MADYSVELTYGTLLNNRYKINKILGTGGFGITYRAYDNLYNRNCAIKEFFPRGIVVRLGDRKSIVPTSDSKISLFEHGKDRFLEEAEILQRLNSVRAVVSVYDFFQENGTCYFVMEYLEGVTLANMAKQHGGILPYHVVEEILKEVGMALIQVHNFNIFHRDISPDNIFITSLGEIKIIDFGNAKNLIRNDEEKLSVVLKPGFAPPEQYSSNGKQGTYTDVYSLASTTYYVLTGKRVPDALDRIKENGYKTIEEYGYPYYVSEAVDNALKLRYKDRTQTIGEFLIQMRLMEGSASIVEKKCLVPVIDVLSGCMEGKRFILTPNTNVVIGRQQGLANIVISNVHISKKHCEMFYDDLSGSFCLVDHSTNGTYVNGERIKKEEIYSFKPEFLLGLGNECVMKVGVKNA